MADDEVLVVWRVDGTDFDVDAFLLRFPELEPDGVWRKGAAQRREPPADSSGFNVTLVECSRADLEEELHLALDAFQEEMAAAGLEAQQSMDLGLMIELDLLGTYLRFGVPLLRRLVELKVDLVTSIYLCSPDEEDNEGNDEEPQAQLN